MKSSTTDTPDKTNTQYPVAYHPGAGLLRRAWEHLSHHVIPLRPHGKAPLLLGWQQRGAATTDEITHWEQTYGPEVNVGLLLGGAEGLVAFDLDIPDAARCLLVEGHIELLLGPTPKRQGNPPKTLLLYRLRDCLGNPVSAPAVNIQVDLDDPTSRIQLLATVGQGKSRQQVVIAGIHPLTEAPYVWTHDILSPGAADIATITEAELQTALESLRARFGVVPGGSQSPQETRTETAGTVTLPAAFPPVPADLSASWGLPPALVQRVRDIDLAQDRSAELLGVVDQLYRARLQDSQILALLTDPAYVSAAVTERRKGSRQAQADWLARYVLPKAKAAFWVPPAQDDFDPVLEQVDPVLAKKHHTRVQLKAISARSLARTPPPPRPWLVQDLLPRGVVTSMYGPPGLGKTMAAVQACLAVMFGASWLGEPVTGGPGVALGVFCEDDGDEIHRRVDAVCRALGYDLTQAPTGGEFLILDRSAEISNIWMEFQGEHGEGKATELYQAFRDYIRAVKPSLIVLDVVADLFGGNENSRRHVNQFVKGALALVARENNVALVILAHPSKSGMADGWGQSGSTSWQGSVRQQLNLLPFHTDGDLNNKATRVDDMTRLVVTKSNYLAASSGLRGDGLALRKGAGGVLLRDVSAGAGAVTGRAAETEALVRQAVRELLAARMAPSLAINNPRNNLANAAVRLGTRRGIRVTRDECQDMAEDMVRRGVLVEDKLFARGNRQAVYGLRLADGESSAPEDNDSPF